MPDKFDHFTRSKIMSKIKHKDTTPELSLRKELCKHGLRYYRLHYDLPGKPDVVFVSKKIVIFTDGDFWHGYNWKILGKVPPKKYWQEKIQRTIQRDKKYTRQLTKKGWSVLRFWEHEIKESPRDVISRIKTTIRTPNSPRD